MHHCTLYDCLIESDRPLFSDLDPDYTTETKPRYSLKLVELQSDEQYQNLDIGTDFYSSHGRELMLYSNREFTQSIKGQPWCFEVKNIVTFYWKSGQSTIYYKLEIDGNNELLTFWFTHIF